MPEIPRGVDFSGVGFLAEWISRGIRLAIREIRRRILVMARPMSWMIHFRRQLRRLYRSTRSTAILAVQTVNGSVRRAFRNPRASRSTRSVGATIPIESRVSRTIFRIWALMSGEFAKNPQIVDQFPSVAYRIRCGYSRRPGGHYIGNPEGACGYDGGAVGAAPDTHPGKYRRIGAPNRGGPPTL